MTTPTIAHYRITSKLGEGGMGTVYRATDTKLKREVAIKVLPESVSRDADRLARFGREARALASLNHPNIATIYGVEEGAIVMELVQGKNLKGPVSIATVIDYGRQIAAGLESAHERGIIHRDLKPGNIKVTPDGVVKLLDFGLAKTAEDSLLNGMESFAVASTISWPMSHTGIILGTAAYMAPEQARGKPVDRRADIWAFGVVLYELLSGVVPFDGETATDLLAALITREPNWSLLPPDTPPLLLQLLQRCLRKDPKSRLRDIGDARLMLDELESPEVRTSSQEGEVRRSQSQKRAWVLSTLSLLAATTIALAVWLHPTSTELAPVHFTIPWPTGTHESSLRAAAQAVPSPDGRLIVFVASSADGKNSLWIRPVASTTARRLENTEGANFPFWSPNGDFVAFFADEKLKKIPSAGGLTQILCDAVPPGGSQNTGDGGSWSSRGVIVFGLGPGSPLMQVMAAGGRATPVTELDSAAGETMHSWPEFLPDGRHVLYLSVNRDPASSAIYVQELGSSRRVMVIKSMTRAAWSPPGYLLFLRDGMLFAQRMELSTYQLAGLPLSVTIEVTSNETNGRSAFAVSSNGVLVYREGSLTSTGQLTWYDRKGTRLGTVGAPAKYQSLRLSPDGKSVALAVGSSGHISPWIIHLASGALTRAANGVETSSDIGPWSPGSDRIAMNDGLSARILELTVSSGKTRMVGGNGFAANDWSPDNDSILSTYRPEHQLALVPLRSELEPRPISSTPDTKNHLRFSPDGKFVAYTVWESERNQVFVASFPSFAERRQISIDGGLCPTWRRDGREIFFRTFEGTVMSVGIETGAKIAAEIPRVLFRYTTTDPYGVTYWPTNDGKRFLVIESVESEQNTQVMVIVNWLAKLKWA